MRATPAVLAALALASCNAADNPPQPSGREVAPFATAALPAPDIAGCDARHAVADDYPLPADPVAIPAEFRPFVASSALELALLTRTGQTFCFNNQGVYTVDDMEWLSGDRLLGWSWNAYEAFGYQVFDRQGDGAMIETGEKPAFSPNGQRLASLQLSNAIFGGLEGFAVWELRQDDLVLLGGEPYDRDHLWAPVFREFDPNDVNGWHLTGWSGNACVGLGYAPRDDKAEDYNRSLDVPFHASQSGGWRVEPGACP